MVLVSRSFKARDKTKATAVGQNARCFFFFFLLLDCGSGTELSVSSLQYCTAILCLFSFFVSFSLSFFCELFSPS
ncbi:hypothetical protein BO86DRAFT_12991 [Aspergillus japonicus CBS 114.51]|uniref:Uncharacterized protein n=1 Tax=Aspergillus japonicus CBS 114.51 TaxID=1448312 RepID=A0A8T8X7U5_ASPJA|nr:hypothetical protein BO86DRAFT_12991 [Aspergillus japonicus CBS 114.51]RAH84121.1 hypothetical protein BO86DRAFT_12991 [Aspergillus japonicus CBS 114.51]